MHLRRVEYFVRAAEEGSLAGAAARMGVAQSTISAGLHALERELGVVLLVRTGRGVRLSEAGETVIEPARAALDAADRVLLAVDRARDGCRGRVRLAVPASLAIEVLPEVLRRMRSELPEVEVWLTRTGRSNDLVADVAAGEVDLAVVVLPEVLPIGLGAQVVIRDRLVLVVPTGHQAAGGVVVLDRIVELGLVDLPSDHPVRTAVDALFRSADVQRTVVDEVASVADALAVVRAGRAVAILPEAAVVRTSGIDLARLDVERDGWVVGVVRSRTASPGAAVDRLATLLSAQPIGMSAMARSRTNPAIQSIAAR